MAGSDVHAVAVTDCGSTTTKALLIERTAAGYRCVARADAATTVEAPVQDVTVGVVRALAALEGGTRRAVRDGAVCRGPGGVDAYLSTSSAGGGLQVAVVGVSAWHSARAAERAAMVSGAIVTETIAMDAVSGSDEAVHRLRRARPDMVLLAGGVDGGDGRCVVELAQWVAAAGLRPRLGADAPLPVVYCGNPQAADEVRRILDDGAEVLCESNVLPRLDVYDTAATASRVHDVFLSHVMQLAPGYAALQRMVDGHILPTPKAVGDMLHLVHDRWGANVVCVDIGGATTDVFSVVDGVFRRTVSANLGMSYSAGAVLRQAGAERVMRWLPPEISADQVWTYVLSKTARPTTVPGDGEELAIEQAVAREAVRLAWEHHVAFSRTRQDSGAVSRVLAGQVRELSTAAVDTIIASGGVLSHAPTDLQTAAMVIDAFAPQGVTHIAKDTAFMLPHLGVLSHVSPQAAWEVFAADCLSPVAVCAAPVGAMRTGAVRVLCEGREVGRVRGGEVGVFPPRNGAVDLVPSRWVDVGKGRGAAVRVSCGDAAAGLVVDCRGRPLPADAPPLEAAARNAGVRR